MRNDHGEKKTRQPEETIANGPYPEQGTDRWDIPGAELVTVLVDGHGIAGFDPCSEFAISIASTSVPYSIRIHGEADLYSAPFLRERLSYLVKELMIRELVIDMTYCVYVDSSALGVLLDVYRELHEAGGTMHLANVHDDVRRIFELTGLDRFIRIVM